MGYLYGVVFEKYPNIVKIGQATLVERRIQQLEITHGVAKVYHKRDFGTEYKKAERCCHARLSSLRHKMQGDGGTEFFIIPEGDDSKTLIESTLCGKFQFPPKYEDTPEYILSRIEQEQITNYSVPLAGVRAAEYKIQKLTKWAERHGMTLEQFLSIYLEECYWKIMHFVPETTKLHKLKWLGLPEMRTNG